MKCLTKIVCVSAMGEDKIVCCASMLEPKDVNKNGMGTEEWRDFLNGGMNEQTGTDLHFWGRKLRNQLFHCS